MPLSITIDAADAQLASMLALAIAVLAASGAMLLLGVRLTRRAKLERMSIWPSVQSALGVVLLFLAIVVFFIALSPLFGILLSLVLLVILAMARSQRRDAQRRALSALIAAAAEKRLPLAAAIAAFALDEGGRFGRRVFQLAEKLNSGVPLAQAIASARRVLPAYTLVAPRVAEQTGDLAAAWKALSAGSLEIQPLVRSAVDKLYYLAWIALCIAPAIVAFMAIKIMPSMKKIFDDFDTQLPAMTQGMIRLFTSSNFQLLASIAFFAGWCFIFYATLGYTGWLGGAMTGFGWLAGPTDVAAVLRALSATAEAGRPLEPMVEQLARHYPRRWLAARLARAALRASAGEPLFEALKRQGLLTAADAALLSAAERAGNLPWALRNVADNTERRLAYRLNGWLQVLFPLTILIVGSAVGFFVVAFFLPIIDLTKGLS